MGDIRSLDYSSYSNHIQVNLPNMGFRALSLGMQRLRLESGKRILPGSAGLFFGSVR